MNLRPFQRQEFLDLVFGHPDDFMGSIERNDVFLVRHFFSRNLVLKFRETLRAFNRSCVASWHPCLDHCPDYHRVNNEYEKSYVKAKMHSYYFHRWNANKEFFGQFKEIFKVKNFLIGQPEDAYYDNIPSQGIISRIVCHQYPRGGGYLAEHLDPVNPFAKIQTIIQASDYGLEFEKGGLYVRETPQSEMIFIDPLAPLGDLVVASPNIRHGVAPVDPQRELDWNAEDGRWMILPIIIRSDYNVDPTTKPRMV